MAIWQFNVVLLPRRWFEQSDHGIEALFDEDGYNTSAAWQYHQPKIDIDLFFANLLPAAKSWHDELKIWGDESESDVQVWYDGEYIESIGIRIDVRENSTAMCLKAVETANVLDCVFLLPEIKLIIEANIVELAHALSRSRAACFNMDSHKFLEELSDGTSNKN